MNIEHKSNTPKEIRDLWRTPEFIVEHYRKRFNFDCDVAASFENAICPHEHFGEQFNGEFHDALADDAVWGLVNWCNPPYSEIMPWVCQTLTQASVYSCKTVMLIPADTSVKWFKVAFDNCTECHFISGRLSFINAETGKPVSGNNKGSVVFIFDPKSPVKQSVHLIDRESMR